MSEQELTEAQLRELNKQTPQEKAEVANREAENSVMLSMAKSRAEAAGATKAQIDSLTGKDSKVFLDEITDERGNKMFPGGKSKDKPGSAMDKHPGSEAKWRAKNPDAPVSAFETRKAQTEIDPETMPDSRRITSEEMAYTPKAEELIPTDMQYVNDAMKSMPASSSEAYLADSATEITLLKGSEQETPEEDFNAAYESLVGVDARDVLEANLINHTLSMTNDIYKVMVQDVELNPGNTGMHETTIAGLKATEDLYKGIPGRQRALADMYSTESSFARGRRETVASMTNGAVFKDFMEKRGVLDKIWDGVGLVIDPVAFTLDAAELAKVDPTVDGATPWHKLANIVGGFQMLDPEIKQEVFPFLLEKVMAATDDNEFKAAAFVGLLEDPRFVSEILLSATLDTAEAMIVLAPLARPAKIVKSLQRLLSQRQLLKRLGNKKVASTTASPRRTQLDEAMDADPTSWEETLVGTNATDGLAKEYNKVVNEIKEGVAQPLRDLRKDDAFVKLDALKADEQNAAVQKSLDRLNGESMDGYEIFNAKIVGRDKKGYSIKYSIDNGEGGLTVRQRELRWSADDAGSLVAEDEQLSKAFGAVYGNKLLSPEVLLRSFDETVVADTTFAGMQSAVVLKEMQSAWKATDKFLKDVPTWGKKPDGTFGLANRDARRAVDELLIAGDEAGQVFHIEDLLKGNVQTLSGKRKYTRQEAYAYMAKRAFIDESHGLQEKLLRDKFNFLGMKQAAWVNPLNGIEELQIAKPFRNGQGWANDKTLDILAPGLLGDTISVAKRGQIDVADAISKGFVPVKFLKPVKMKDGKSVEYGLIPGGAGKGSVSELPTELLHRVPGYVPRISKPGYHYVKDVDTGHTMARFKTKANADNYAQQQMAAKNISLKSGEQPMRLHAFRDRDFNAVDSAIEDANTYGGLYTGARSKDALFAGDDLAGEVTRLSAGQSMGRMMDNISFQMPLNEYRIGVVNRWKESAKQALRNEGFTHSDRIMRDIDSPDMWNKTDLAAINDNATRQMLLTHREYIVDTMRVAHKDENRWSGFMMNIADAIPDAGIAKKLGFRDMAVSIASKNPVQALKGATFDAYLGWFNPRQLYIQMQNAALAGSMYPRQAMTAVPQALIQRAFLYTPTVDKELLARAAKGVVGEPKALDDMVESLEQFKRSGLRDGVMRSGDYDASLAGFSSGTLDGYRELAAKGRIFFEEGESMARLITWNIARKNFKEANPGVLIDDAAIRGISDDVLRMNMNMQRENAAWWQKNAFTAIPTQFLQVQAKMVENIVGGFSGKGAWTQKEAAMALGGQIALYGTAGVYLAEDAEAYVKEQISGDELAFQQNNPNWNQMLDRGMTGVFTSSLGMANNFSESANILAGMDDNVLFDVLGSFGEVLSGNAVTMDFKAPALGVVKRGGDAMMTAFEAVQDIMVAPTVETVGDSVFKVIDSFASIASSWSNARKVIFLKKLGGIQKGNGDIAIALEEMEGMNFQTLMARAMGMPTDIEDAYYKQKLWNFDRQKAKQDTAKSLTRIYNELSIDGNKEKYQANFSLIMSEYEDQPGVGQDIINSQIKKLSNPRSVLERDTSRFIKDFIKSGGNIGTRAFQGPLVNQNPDAEVQ